ncbi:MAG TPA: signal peptidase I [Candidatus Saccharimonadales bacterium]
MNRAFLQKVLLAIVACTVLLTSSAYADVKDLTVDTGCSKLPSYTGVLAVEKGNYDVYVRLAKRGEKAKVSTYTQAVLQEYGECDQVGTVTATGDQWTKAGVIHVDATQDYTLQLSSTALAKIPDANRPSIMLVPQNGNTICHPTDECYVTISGEKGYVRPIGTLLNQDSLHAMTVKDPATDKIKTVRYYTDGVLVYTAATFQPFDERYIEYGGQSLTRVVVYASGQQAVVETEAPITFQGNFGNFLFRTAQRYPKALMFLFWLCIGLVVSFLLLLIARALKRRQDDRVHHGFAQEHRLNFIEKAIYFIQAQRFMKWVRLVALGGLTLAGVGVLIVVTSSYLLQIISVDGHSMEKTYFTGNNVLVNKVPKTLSVLNGREYLPERGEVVIVRASFGNAILSGEDNTDLTLIKRVIALPGERVSIKNGELKVYNGRNPEGFSPDKGSPWEGQMTPDEKTESIDIQLGPSEIFVSGDNRPASIDSRFNGPIATREIIGVVVAKL